MRENDHLLSTLAIVDLLDLIVNRFWWEVRVLEEINRGIGAALQHELQKLGSIRFPAIPHSLVLERWKPFYYGSVQIDGHYPLLL